MLYREISPDAFVPWNGEPIGEIYYDRLIEFEWSDEELAAIGLHRPGPAEPVPYGKRSIGQTVARIEGVVRCVDTLEDIPLDELRAEIFRPLQPYQFWAVVRATGHELALRDWVETIEDPIQYGLASAMLEFSLEFRRDHPLMEAAREELDITPAELDDLWLWGLTL